MLAGKGGKSVHHHPCDMGIRSLIQFYQINIGGAGVEITLSLTGTQLGKRLRGGIFPKNVRSAKAMVLKILLGLNYLYSRNPGV